MLTLVPKHVFLFAHVGFLLVMPRLLIPAGFYMSRLESV